MCCQHSFYFIIIIVILLAIILLLIFRMRHYFILSETDEMTSISNYRGFRRKIKKVIAVNKKNGSTFCIAILDIDRFKRFNDQSYDFGDTVLKDFVRFIKEELPEDTFVARFRLGDEFIILLNGSEEEASERMKNIRDKGRDAVKPTPLYKDRFPITFSYGLAEFNKEKDTPESLMERAEKALKINKQIVES